MKKNEFENQNVVTMGELRDALNEYLNERPELADEVVNTCTLGGKYEYVMEVGFDDEDDFTLLQNGR